MISKGFILTVCASLFWAISIVTTRIILNNGENVYNLSFWTLLIASPYWLYQLNRQKKEISKLKIKDFAILLVMGLVSTVGVSLAESFALKYSQATNFAFLIRTVIVFTFIFAYIFLGEKITKKKIILAAFILSGAYLLTTNGQQLSLSTGDIFTLLEAALIAFGTGILGKLATNRMSPNTTATGRFFMGVVPLFIIALSQTSISLPHLLPLVILITICSITLNTLLFYALKISSATFVTMIMSFTPVFVSFIAIPVLGESLSLIQVTGGLFILLAGIMVEKLKI